MRVLVTDKIDVTGLNLLEDAGHDVDVRINLSPEALVELIPNYDALIVRSATRVTREVIEAGSKLKIIGRAGVVTDGIDIEAATEHGIIVCNAPTSNIVSAAEQAMALMLAVARRIPQANQSMHEGKWERSRFIGSELAEKTLAICGLGRIGGLVAERARAFEMKLIGYDPYCSPERATHLHVRLYDDIMDICRRADFITVHLPRTRETVGMFGAQQYSAMKDGVYLVNCARDGIFNIDALADFVVSGKVAGAAIDVFEGEPITQSPLHGLENVILTPHIGASTKEAQTRAGVQIAEYVSMGLDGRMVPTAVNVAHVPGNIMEVLGPYIGASQMAGSVIAQVAREGISSLEVDVRGALASHDIHMLGTAALRAIFAESSNDPVNFVNADYIAEQRGIKVHTTQDPESTDYANLVTFTAHAGKQTIEIATTLNVMTQAPRIVSLFGYNVDLIPEKNVMILEYEDKPGKLGTIGTIIGRNNINISTMQLGNSGPKGGAALVLMNVDQPVPDDVKAEIAEAVEVIDAWYLHLF